MTRVEVDTPSDASSAPGEPSPRSRVCGPRGKLNRGLRRLKRAYQPKRPLNAETLRCNQMLGSTVLPPHAGGLTGLVEVGGPTCTISDWRLKPWS